MILSITCEKDAFGKFQTIAEGLIEKVAQHEIEAKREKKPELPELVPTNEGIKTAGQVQFVALAGDCLKGELSYTGALKVLKTIMAYDYLWVNIRVKGGAYGCMCNFIRNGNSYFVSYRDPNLAETIDVYKAVSDYVKDLLSDTDTLYLQTDTSDKDRYDRLLRYVWLDVPDDVYSKSEIKEKMLNAILVEKGIAEAVEYEPDTAYADLFEELE